jgi:hypothetical protein
MKFIQLLASVDGGILESISYGSIHYWLKVSSVIQQ